MFLSFVGDTSDIRANSIRRTCRQCGCLGHTRRQNNVCWVHDACCRSGHAEFSSGITDGGVLCNRPRPSCRVVGVRPRTSSSRLWLRLVLLPHQPFHGDLGMVHAASPPEQGFGCNGVRKEAMHTKIPTASQGHGHLFEQIAGRAHWNSCMKDRHLSFSRCTSD